MSQDLDYSDVMILKRCCDAAKEVGGLDKIKAELDAALKFREKTVDDFNLLADRYGTRDAADMLAKAIRADERASAGVH